MTCQRALTYNFYGIQVLLATEYENKVILKIRTPHEDA